MHYCPNLCKWRVGKTFQGVETASQKRYVEYYEVWYKRQTPQSLRNPLTWPRGTFGLKSTKIQLTQIVITGEDDILYKQRRGFHKLEKTRSRLTPVAPTALPKRVLKASGGPEKTSRQLFGAKTIQPSPPFWMRGFANYVWLNLKSTARN